MALKYLSEAGIKEIFRLCKQKYLAKADASDVATSGSYTDLKDKPTKVSEWQNDAGYLLPADIAGKADASALKAVAYSGSYNDLTNKPTIPTVPTISTNISADAASNTKTVSPAAVVAYVAASGGGEINVDAELDQDSQNPVQNKAIYAALDDKANALEVAAALISKVSVTEMTEALAYKADKTELPGVSTGTFTEHYSTAPDLAVVKQYGRIASVSVWLPMPNGLNGGSDELGTISGVGVPVGDYATCACVTRTPGGQAHSAMIDIIKNQDGTAQVRLEGAQDHSTDTYVIFNCVYITAE